MTLHREFIGAALIATILLLLCGQDAALAQAARHPFASGGAEGAGAATGFAGLIAAWQSKFQLELQGAVRALKSDASALLTLLAGSFAYGVFHAAGPGHGKAVLASYMIANETALRRGVALAALAALVQGGVAIALVGAVALAFNATAQEMSGAAAAIDTAAYLAIVAVGARLVWTKGRAIAMAVGRPATESTRLRCEAVDDPAHVHGPSCSHLRALDAALPSAEPFAWGQALAAAAAAGLRPCSGAILVLVFSLAQGVFRAGVLATLAMAAGTAVTTGALAIAAVLAKNAALKLAPGSKRGAILLRGAEFLAALLVLGLGLALLAGAAAGQT